MPASVGPQRVVRLGARRIFPGWLYRRAVTVANGVSALTYAQVDIILSSGNFDFSKANSNGSDLRFADGGGRALNHWIEAYDSVAQTAMVSVLVPSVPAGTSTIYIYYGRVGATTTSGWAGTFVVPPAPITSQVLGTGPHDFNAFPSVVPLANGDTLLFYVSGDADGAANSDTYMLRSTDQGLTWGAPALAFANSGGLGASVQNRGIQLVSGTILVALTYLAPPFTGTLAKVSTSTDNGATWSAPATIAPPAGYTLMQFYGPMQELTPGGTIWASAYAYNTVSGFVRALLLQSIDGGANWTLRSVIASGANLNYTETAVYRVDATRSFAFIREDNNLMLHYVASSDDGLTWGAPIIFCLVGMVSPTIRKLATSGELLLMAGRRGNIYGIAAWLSTDDGITWSGRAMPVKDSAISQIGYPSAIEMSDGRIGFASYSDPTGSGNPCWVYWRIMPKAFLTNPQFEGWETNIEMDWDYYVGDGLLVGTTHVQSGAKAMEINDTGAWIDQIVSGLSAGALGDVTLWWYPITATNGLIFSLLSGIGVVDATTKYRFHIRISASGAIQYYNGSAWTALPTPTTLSLDTAYHKIRLRWATATNQCEVLVNGVSKGTIGQYEAGGIITRGSISSGSGGGSGDHGWIDTIYQRPYIATPPTTTVGAEMAG